MGFSISGGGSKRSWLGSSVNTRSLLVARYLDIDGHQRLLDAFVEHNKALVEHSKTVLQQAHGLMDSHRRRRHRLKPTDSD
jgi:hypothetical protein